MAVFQNISIQSLYPVLLRYINYVDMQGYYTVHKSDGWLLSHCVINTRWRHFKIKYIVYILYTGLMKHETLFKYKATNILEVNQCCIINSNITCRFLEQKLENIQLGEAFFIVFRLTAIVCLCSGWLLFCLVSIS